eukprot:TRINITY_DN574_c0_g2_i2.p1 TRINITY_DN574_c0_g2~~TRINITY_DN574_c0_g2_i2.p1  ORF type:complete len:463 (+),score=132.98 TRINITY_DN574_c0_g2_i2:53-1390(+)
MSAVLVEGWLEKTGGFVFAKKQDRWLRLEGLTLSYWREQPAPGTAPVCAVDLRQLSSVEENELGFLLKGPFTQQPEYDLTCSSREERDQWLSSLRSVLKSPPAVQARLARRLDALDPDEPLLEAASPGAVMAMGACGDDALPCGLRLHRRLLSLVFDRPFTTEAEAAAAKQPCLELRLPVGLLDCQIKEVNPQQKDAWSECNLVLLLRTESVATPESERLAEEAGCAIECITGVQIRLLVRSPAFATMLDRVLRGIKEGEDGREVVAREQQLMSSFTQDDGSYIIVGEQARPSTPEFDGAAAPEEPERLQQQQQPQQPQQPQHWQAQPPTQPGLAAAPPPPPPPAAAAPTAANQTPSPVPRAGYRPTPPRQTVTPPRSPDAAQPTQASRAPVAAAVPQRAAAAGAAPTKEQVVSMLAREGLDAQKVAQLYDVACGDVRKIREWYE